MRVRIIFGIRYGLGTTNFQGNRVCEYQGNAKYYLKKLRKMKLDKINKEYV